MPDSRARCSLHAWRAYRGLAVGTESCPFCSFAPERCFFADDLVCGLWDTYPASPGHALLIPRRHATNWFDATPEEQQSLVQAIEVVGNIEGISFIYFDERDVVRHSLVQRIIKAYDERAAAKLGGANRSSVAGNSVSRNPRD